MVLLSIFFTRIRSTEGSSCRLFFIHFVAPCACSSSSRLKYSSNLSVWRFEHVNPLHTSVGCISHSRMPAGPHFVTQPILLSENIPNIWHKSQQNTRRSDQIETIKTIMQTTRPRITWKVLPMAQVAIFKEIFDQVRKDLDCELFYSELKRHASHIIFTI